MSKNCYSDFTLIFIALLVLKLTVRPDLLWTAVFAPYWAPIIISLFLLMFTKKEKK